jgi:hypothetical protein
LGTGKEYFDRWSGRSRLRVTFKNFGKPSSITFDLVREGGQWKVSNIRSARWGLLRLLE